MKKIKYIQILTLVVGIALLGQLCNVVYANVGSDRDTKNKWASSFAKKSDVQTLTVGIDSMPLTLDPGMNQDIPCAHILNNTFEGLVREVNGKIEPAVASSYLVSEDGRTYTFKIRNDVKWSDGTPLTAYDFEYAWNRVVNLQTKSDYGWLFEEAHIESWIAIDKNTFQVTLYEPTPYFVGMTGDPTFFPVKGSLVDHAWDGTWSLDPETAVSNGPFKLKIITSGGEIILEANPYYWQKEKVNLDKIKFQVIEDDYVRFREYKMKLIDIIDYVPVLVDDPTFEVLAQDGTFYYTFNQTIKPLNDIRVRKALSLAVDRREIVESILMRGETPAHTLIPDTHLDTEGNIFNKMIDDYDIKPAASIEEARALLAEAGYPNGDGFPTFQIRMSESARNIAIAEAIQKMWKNNLGIDVTLKHEEWPVFKDARRNGEFEIVSAGWLGDYTDPMTYLDMFTMESHMNFTNWYDETYEAYIEASKTAKGQERFELLYKAESILSNSYVVMPIYHYSDVQMVSKKVSGLDKTSRSVFYFGQTQMIEYKH